MKLHLSFLFLLNALMQFIILFDSGMVSAGYGWAGILICTEVVTGLYLFFWGISEL